MLSKLKCMLIGFTSFTAILFAGSPAWSQSHAVGPHDMTCSTLIELVAAEGFESTAAAAAAIFWIEGYLSGANAMNQEGIDLEPQTFDGEARMEIILTFCMQNPGWTMEEVAQAYYLALIEYQPATS